jgi:hypothetical protein
MGYKTWVFEEIPSATVFNDEIRDQVISRFASEAARTSAISLVVPGQYSAINSNDAAEGLYHRTSAGTWRPPWNLPWGLVPSGAPAIIASQGGMGTGITDILGLSVTWSAVANRAYRVTFTARLDSNHGAAQVAGLLLRDAANNTTGLAQVTLAANATVGDSATATGVWVGTRTAGTQVLKLSAQFTAGAGNAVLASANEGAFLIVEDIGPSGAPS